MKFRIKRVLLSISTMMFSMIVLLSCSEGSDDAKYLNPDNSVDVRVANLLSRMTLEEKVYQMDQFVGLEHMQQREGGMSAVEMRANDAQAFYEDLHSSEVEQMVKEGKIGSFLHTLTLKEANYLQKISQQSRLKIPLLIGIDAIHGNAQVSGTTVYPTPIGLAGTFDDELVEEISRQTALEMRATGSHWTFTPNIDVARDARWGRVGETFGEDPFLVTNMGVAMINGLQQGDFTGYEKVIACAKHMIAGSEPSNGLNAAPMDVSERTLREVYLPPYKAAVEAGVFTVMAAHNELNGIPCHANKWMLTEILRDEYGFDGFIVSDWMDIERISELHRTAENIKEAVFQSVDAGMDMHMHGPGFATPLIELVNEGRISEERINEAVSKILEAKFKLGLFENPFADEEVANEVVNSAAHQAKALEAARKSIALLKNDGVLPLSQSNVKKILVTGPNSANETTLGDWTQPQPEENVITVLEGLRQIAPEGVQVTHYDAGDHPMTMDKDKITAIEDKAKNYDLVIAVVGENSLRWNWNTKTSGENTDRADIDLPGLQLELIQSVVKSGTPVVVVLVNGSPLAIPWVTENVDGIVEAWEPGNLGGQAIAEILFGKVNPSGKIPMTFPRSVGQIQMIYNHKPSQYYHHYYELPNTPLYAFGYGLSYTTFEYSDLLIPTRSIKNGESTTVSVTVTNTGDVAGDEVIQLYINDLFSSVTRPVKELKAYRRISLEPGQSKTISFTITPDMLSYFDIEMTYGVEAGEFEIMVGGSSRDEDQLIGKITVVDK